MNQTNIYNRQFIWDYKGPQVEKQKVKFFHQENLMCMNDVNASFGDLRQYMYEGKK